MQSSGSGFRERRDRVEIFSPEIIVSEEVRMYLGTQPCDYRICTSCGGPILLPITIKKPKSDDLKIPVGDRTLYVSRYQAPFLHLIDREMIPHYLRHYDY